MKVQTGKKTRAMSGQAVVHLDERQSAIDRDVRRGEQEAGVYSFKTRVSRQYTSSANGRRPRLQRRYKARRWQLFQPPEESTRAFDGDDGEGVLIKVAPDWVEEIVLRRLEGDGRDPVATALARLADYAYEAGLSPREHEAVRLKVENPDWHDARIGRVVGVARSTVANLTRDARIKLIRILPSDMVERAARLVSRTRLRQGRYTLHVDGLAHILEGQSRPILREGETQ